MSRLSEALLRNVGIKLVALLLAVVAWYAIREKISFEKWVTDIPIQVQVDEDWAVLDLDPLVATIKFRGPEEAVWDLDRENVGVDVDVRGHIDKGTLPISLTPENVLRPGGVRVVEIQPARVFLSVDQEGTVKVPVRADLQGDLPKGFEVESVTCRPATVDLSGPRQRIEQIQAVSTAPIDLESRLRSFQKRVALEPPEDEVWAARVDPNSAIVEVKIVERSAARTIDRVPVRTMMAPDQAVTAVPWPSEVSVALSGHAEALEGIDPGGVYAYVDCGGLAPGSEYELPVRVHAPAGASVLRTEPASVRVTLGAR